MFIATIGHAYTTVHTLSVTSQCFHLQRFGPNLSYKRPHPGNGKKDRANVAIITNRKSQPPFQMKWKSSTLDDFEGHRQPVQSAILATAAVRFALFISLRFSEIIWESQKKGRCETRILCSISDILRESQRNKKCETRPWPSCSFTLKLFERMQLGQIIIASPSRLLHNIYIQRTKTSTIVCKQWRVSIFFAFNLINSAKSEAHIVASWIENGFTLVWIGCDSLSLRGAIIALEFSACKIAWKATKTPWHIPITHFADVWRR